MRALLIFSIAIFTMINCSAQVKLLSLNELKQRIAKGKDTTYVINFWATWCAPCVEELPFFEKLNKENEGKAVKVILMSLDFRSKLTAEVIPFVKKNKVKSEVFVANAPDQQIFIEGVSKDWSGALPATWFVNASNRINAFHEKQFTYEELSLVLSRLKAK